MAISPSAVPDLISMEIVSSLSGSCACFQVPPRCLSDPVDQSGCEGGGRQDKVVSLIFFFFTSFRDFSVRLLFPAHAAEGLPFILEILFLSPPCVVPHFLFLVPCRKRGGFHSIPFLLFCRASWHPPSCLHALDWWRLKKKKKKKKGKKRGGNRKQREDREDLPFLLSSACAHTSWNRRMKGRRQSGSDVCAPHLFFLSLCLPPLLLSTSLFVCVSLPLSLSLCLLSLSAFLSVSAPRRFTQGQAALSWRVRWLYACRDICECAYAGGD